MASLWVIVWGKTNFEKTYPEEFLTYPEEFFDAFMMI